MFCPFLLRDRLAVVRGIAQFGFREGKQVTTYFLLSSDFNQMMILK